MSRAEILAGMLPDERSAALVTSPLSLRYLCGCYVESGLAIIGHEESVLFVPERIYQRVSGRVSGFKVTALTNGQQLLDLLIKYGIKRVFIEADKMSVSEWKLFREQLHYAELCDTEDLSEWLVRMRTVKSSEEIAAIRRAQAICDDAYERLLGSVRKGMTERQILSLIDYYLAEAGSEGSPFQTVVLSGENTARLNVSDRRPLDRVTESGDLIIMEFGARVDGYCAKMSRTIGVGSVDPQIDEAYRAVSCAISDGVKALRAGIGGKVADSVARSTLNAWGFDKYSSGSFAHGIGLEEFEAPFLGRRSSAVLRPDTVLAACCEIKLPGKFGIRTEDTAVLGEEGCMVLTKATRTLVLV